MLTLHLDDGEELLFILDTVSSVTVLDKSLESKLGSCFWTHRLWHEWYGVKVVKLFRAPKLYLGNTQLPTGCWIHTADLSIMSSERNRILHTNRQIMGVLGFDCLKYYCILLYFSADKMCFLDPEHSNQQDWGKAFPLTAFNSGCFSVRENLTGVKGPGSLIDAGCNFDGWLTPKLFQQWTNQMKLPASGEARYPNGMLGGDTYPDIYLNGDGKYNGIGLRFLARHLVTFDFPKRTMYLKRTSIGPLTPN